MALTVTGSPPACVLGQPFAFQPIVSGGVGPYVYALSGPVPLGLYLDNFVGAVLGTPAELEGPLTGIVFTVVDSTNATGSLTFGLSVVAPTVSAPVVTGYDASVPNVSGTGYPGATLAITVDGVQLFGTSTVPKSGNWRHLLPAQLLPYTGHTVSATQTFAGLTSAASAVFSLVATATPPATPIQPPPLGGPTGGLPAPGGGSASTGGTSTTLNALTLSNPNAIAGTAWTSTVQGLTAGSTYTATSPGVAITVSGSTISGTFATAGSPVVTIVETLAGATGSPRTSTPTVTVAAAAASASHTADNSNTTADTTALTADAA